MILDDEKIGKNLIKWIVAILMQKSKKAYKIVVFFWVPFTTTITYQAVIPLCGVGYMNSKLPFISIHCLFLCPYTFVLFMIRKLKTLKG